jgi:hypothetical protein
MGALDANGCGSIGAGELLPPRAEGGDGPSELTVRHLADCSRCASALAESNEVAAQVRALPRWAAPAGPATALSFQAVLERLDEPALDVRLATEEPLLRRLLAGLARLRAPASLEAPEVEPAPVLRLVRVPLHALAAAAALLAAVTVPLFASSRAPKGLAAQTAQLSQRTPIEVRVVDVAAGSLDAARVRAARLPAPVQGGP